MKNFILFVAFLSVPCAAWLIGWGVGVLLEIYWKYRTKRNHANHPKLVLLGKERNRLCKEYRQWWDERHEAQKRIDINYEILKYCAKHEGEKYFSHIEQDRQIYTNANEHIEELTPLIASIREAEDKYKKEHNIRHW